MQEQLQESSVPRTEYRKTHWRVMGIGDQPPPRLLWSHNSQIPRALGRGQALASFPPNSQVSQCLEQVSSKPLSVDSGQVPSARCLTAAPPETADQLVLDCPGCVCLGLFLIRATYCTHSLSLKAALCFLLAKEGGNYFFS